MAASELPVSSTQSLQDALKLAIFQVTFPTFLCFYGSRVVIGCYARALAAQFFLDGSSITVQHY